MNVTITVNGERTSHEVEDRTLLVHHLRDTLGLTATNVGCDTSTCGSCTVLLNGESVKSCTVLAAQADGEDVRTLEGLARDGEMDAVQRAFQQHHALQCGFCTPGMVMSALDLCQRHPNASETQIREQLEGNLCRCTGYQNIVKAVHQGAAAMRQP